MKDLRGEELDLKQGSPLPSEKGTPFSFTCTLKIKIQAQNLASNVLMCSILLESDSQFENKYCTEMRSGSEAGSYLRRIDFVYHSTLGLRVIKKEKIRFENSSGRCLSSPRAKTVNALYLPVCTGISALNLVYGASSFNLRILKYNR